MLKLAIHHIGARGETQPFPQMAKFQEDVINVLYEADVSAIPQLRNIHAGKAGTIIIPACIAGATEPREFIQAQHEYCHSLLPANPGLGDLYISPIWLDYDYVISQAVERKSSATINAVTLDAAIARYGDDAPLPDFLSLDTQGSELEILRGAPNSLNSAVCIVCEVEFLPLYAGQPLFGDVSEFLTGQGFVFSKFFTILSGSHYRAPLGLRAETIPVTTDALFLRSPQSIIDGNGSDTEKGVRLRKLAFMALAYGFIEHALSALGSARQLPSFAESSNTPPWLTFINAFDAVSRSFPPLLPPSFADRQGVDAQSSREAFARDVAAREEDLSHAMRKLTALLHENGFAELETLLIERLRACLIRLHIPIETLSFFR